MSTTKKPATKPATKKTPAKSAPQQPKSDAGKEVLVSLLREVYVNLDPGFENDKLKKKIANTFLELDIALKA